MIELRNAITPTDPASTLLAYSLLTEPDPLQINGAGILTLVVSRNRSSKFPSETVTSTEIKVTLLVGKSAGTLTPDASGIETQLPDGWGKDSAGGVITLTPAGDAGVFGPEGISFVFAGFNVNREPGTTTVKIHETASSRSQPSTERTAEFLVPKFPARFQLSDLTLTDPPTPHIPYDGSATLMWTGMGDGVSYSLEYEPDDEGGVITLPVQSTGPRTVGPLTRTGSVFFTLKAKVKVPGQDNPLIVPRQLMVSIETPRLKASMQPVSVPPNGLARLEWHALNMASCTLDPGGLGPAGQVLEKSGVLFFLIPASPATRLFSITATPAKGEPSVQQFTISVDPSIKPNQPAIEVTGQQGPTGQRGADRQEPFRTAGDGGPGGRGLDAALTQTLAALDLTSNPPRVVPINVTGGKGGTGGAGGDALGWHSEGPGGTGGRGGAGADAALNLTIDPSLQPSAQYVINVIPGPGGYGGEGGRQSGQNGQPGPPGSTSMAIKEAPEQKEPEGNQDQTERIQ
jgi:hypothetical protein